MAIVNDKLQGNYIFGLDIGTRSVVGIVGYKDNGIFKVMASSVIAHDTRSMIDGQIHDIGQVSEVIKRVKIELEKKLEFSLEKVCIAAAGRVLKTTTVHVEQEIDTQKNIDDDLIYSLELLGMERAHSEMNKELDALELGYHCVGYSVIKYYLNDYEINNLKNHKGKKIGADVLATFLPNEVVNSLYKVVENAGLEVYSLTLEPIAAISIAIPQNYRLLNIALVDIGAGTSDIAITKDGSIIGYGMIPVAGDEITEELVHGLLVDFNTAERIKMMSATKKKTCTYKDIMGLSQRVTIEDVNKMITDKVTNLAKQIGQKIIELNGEHATNAVFVVGGGGQVKGFTDALAGELGIDKTRVAIRGKEILSNIEVDDLLKKSPEVVTPLGICITGLEENKHDFIQVFFNDEPITIFNTNNLTVMDIAAFKGYNPKKLITSKGKDLKFYINGLEKIVKGEYGDAANIMVNNEPASLNSPVTMNDYITIVPAKEGRNGQLTTNSLQKELPSIKVYINGVSHELSQELHVNDNKVSHNYTIKNRDKITTALPSISQVITRLKLDYSTEVIFKNSEEVKLSEGVNDGDIIEFKDEAVKSLDKKSLAINVIVNGEAIVLDGKQEYFFVDIFDHIDFDRTKPQGELICLINEKKSNYLDNLKEHDNVRVYWKND